MPPYESTAEQINRITANPQTAAPTPEPGLWKRMGDYISNTNLRDVAEGLGRINPATIPAYWARDIAQGKFVDNMRLNAGQVSQIPTDVVGGVVGLYPAASAISQLTGMRDTPLPGAETLGNAADAVRDFGRSYGDVIAGRPLPDPDLLRGTGAEMAGNIARFVPTIVTPVQGAWVTKMTNAISKIDTGSQVLNKAGEIGLKTLEALTPLAVSAQATPKLLAVNAGVGVPMAIAGEAAQNALVEKAKNDARVKSPTEADVVADKENKQAHAATDAMLQGTDQLGITTPKPKTTQAGFTTGDDSADVAVAAVGALALLGGYKREAIRRAANNLNSSFQKAVTSYDPNLPQDKSTQHLGTKLRQQWTYDAASQEATAIRIERERGRTASEAREIVREQNELRSKRQGASVGTRKLSLENDGKFVDSQITLARPANDFAVEVSSLDPTRRNTFNTLLHYENEVDNRTNEFRKLFGNTGPWNQPPIASPWMANKLAHNLPHIDTPQMQTFIRGARQSDPDVARLADEYKDIVRKHGRYMGEQGRFQASDVAQFQRNRPNYVPPNVKDTDSLLDPIQRRTFDKASGRYVPRGAQSLEELGDPLALLGRYSDEVFRSTEGKKSQRDFMNYLYDARARGSQYARDLLGRDVGLDPIANQNVVKWRDAHGALKTTEINDAVLANSVKGLTNPSALQLAKGINSTLARWTEHGSVGVESLVLGGSLFSPKAALYSATAGTLLNRPPGIRMGWADVGLHKTTEKLLGTVGLERHAFGLRGDPTMLGDMVVRAAKNMYDVSTHYAGTALHNSVLRSGWLSELVGAQTAERWAQSMKNQFDSTMTKDHQMRGLMGPSSFEAVDRAKIYKDASGAFQVQGAPAMTYNYLQDMLHAISSAPGMSIRAMNKGVSPDWKIDSAIRNMAGDPGRSGAFRKSSGEAGPNRAAEWVNATPWGNVFLQSNYKLFSSFNPMNPKETAKVAATLATGVTVPAIGLTMWNASLGPEYSEYQYHTRTPDKRASSYYIGIPGRAPNEGVEIPIDPGLRPIKQIGEIVAGHLFGAYTGELFKPENAEMRGALGEAVGHRDQTVTKNSALRQSIFQSIIPPVPTIFEMAIAAAGGQVRDFGDVRFNKPDKKGGYSEAEGGDPRAGIFGNIIPGELEDIIQAVGGTAADATVRYIESMAKDLREGRGPLEAAKQVGREWTQRFKDSTDELGSGPLFNNPRAITPSTAASTVMAQKKNATMKEIAQAVSGSTEKGIPKGDMIGDKKAGYSYSIGQGPPGPPDEATLAFGQRVQEYNRQLQPSFTQVNRLYDELSRIRNDNSFKPDERRAYQEVTANKIIEVNKAILADQRRYEQILSQQFGVKVSFDTFDRTKSVLQQYPPLAQTMQGR